jgi:hypothetical protein
VNNQMQPQLKYRDIAHWTIDIPNHLSLSGRLELCAIQFYKTKSETRVTLDTLHNIYCYLDKMKTSDNSQFCSL